jgi:hypothetical protein
MDVVVAIVVVVTAGQEEDHVVADQVIITTPGVDTVVAIVKEMAKGTIRIMIAIRVMVVIVTEWNAALIRVENVPTKATMVGVATKETMANVITKVVPTDHLETEEETLMRHEVTAAATVAVHPVELLEDHLEEVVVVMMAEIHRTLKNKVAVKPESSHLIFFWNRSSNAGFFLWKRLLRHLDSQTGIRHHFQLYFFFLFLSNYRHYFFCTRRRMKRNPFRTSRTNNSARVKTLLFLRRESFLHLLFTFFSVDLHVSCFFPDSETCVMLHISQEFNLFASLLLAAAAVLVT